MAKEFKIKENLSVTGTVNATEFNSLSDSTFKSNVKNIENPFDIVNDLQGVSFNWKNTEKKSYGFVAQDIEKILPEIINNSDYKTVNYAAIIPFLLEAIKKLKQEVDQLKQQK